MSASQGAVFSSDACLLTGHPRMVLMMSENHHNVQAYLRRARSVVCLRQTQSLPNPLHCRLHLAKRSHGRPTRSADLDMASDDHLFQIQCPVWHWFRSVVVAADLNCRRHAGQLVKLSLPAAGLVRRYRPPRCADVRYSWLCNALEMQSSSGRSKIFDRQNGSM